MPDSALHGGPATLMFASVATGRGGVKQLDGLLAYCYTRRAPFAPKLFYADAVPCLRMRQPELALV